MFYNFTTKAGPLHPLFVYSLSIALSVGQGGKEGQFLFIVLLRKVTMKEMVAFSSQGHATFTSPWHVGRVCIFILFCYRIENPHIKFSEF